MLTILRPMTTAELLDRTFFLYRKHFVLFAGIVAIPHLFSLAVSIGRVAVVGVGYRFGAGAILWGALGGVVALLAMTASQAAAMIAVSDVHLDRPATISASFAAVGTRVFKLMLIMIGVMLGIFAGFVLFIIPGIILALNWSLVIPVAVLEGKGLSAATRRSTELAKGDRGRIFVVFFLFTVLVYTISSVLQLPALAIFGIAKAGNAASMAKAATGFLVISTVMTFISQCLVGPLLTIAMALIYYDERVRKEAFDLQVLMSAVQASPPVSPATGAPA
jgi:hypothetical protein